MIAQPLAFKVAIQPKIALISGNKLYRGRDGERPTSIDVLSIPEGMIAPEEAWRLLDQVYVHGRTVFYSHRFWTLIEEARLRLPLFTGWIIESLHFVGSAPRRMTQSLAHQRDSLFKHLLAIHAVEEWDHEKFFVDALRRLGYPADFAASRRPLPETNALITVMRSIARQDAFAYAAVGGFLESTRDDDANRRFNEILVEGGAPADVVTAVQAHEDLDRELEHRGLIEQLLDAHGPVSGSDFAFAVGSVLLMVDALVDWVEAMANHYQDGSVLRYRDPAFARAFDPAGVTVPQPVGSLEPAQGDGGPLAEAIDALPGSVRARLRLLSALSLNRWTPSGLELALKADQASLRELFKILDRGELCWELNPIPSFRERAGSDKEPADRVSTWRRVFEHWLRGVYGERFWTWILEPERTDAEIAGWLLENYHYIRSAQDHMTGAASNCADPGWLRILASHFAEEIDHYLIFGRGLEESGVPRSVLVESRPLPTTAAMTARLTELALTDTAAYVLADQALQYSATVAKDTNDAFYERLIAAHPRMAPGIGAFLKHDDVDCGLGHDALFDPILNELDPFDPRLGPSIEAAGGMMLAFCHYLRGIHRWYGKRAWTVEDRRQAYARDDQVAPRTPVEAASGG